MNQLMESGHKPVPLPEKDIDNLLREPITDESKLIMITCLSISSR